MVSTVIDILNARLQLTGFFHSLYCLAERKRERREDGDFVYPAQYVGGGDLQMIEFDSAGFAYFRKDGEITQSIVENDFGQSQWYEVTIPLKLVAMVNRSDVNGDDAFSPDALARKLASSLTFKNGDLRTALTAAKTQVNAVNWITDPEQIWSDETEGTGALEPDYRRAFIAMSVTVTVTADEKCIQNLCTADTDILHIFDFCKAATVARLTEVQRECLEDALCPPCEDVDITINSTPFGTSPSGGTFNVPVVNGGDNPVGSEQSGEWVIGNSTVTINGTQVGDIVAEDSLPIAVELDGNPSGTWNAGTQTWEVTSTPCAPATFSIDGTQVDTIASGADLDVSVELNGNPVTPTYNIGTKVIGVTGSSLSTLSVAVSNANPDVGQSITITATPTGFTPTDYYFYAKQGSTLVNIGSSVSGVINWTVTLVGALEIYAQAHDNSASAFNIGGELVTGVAAVITSNCQLWYDPFRSNIVAPNYPDLSGFGRNGTLVNTPTVVVGSLAANDGGYIGLNGVNQYIGSIGTVADFAFVQNTLNFSMGGFFYIGSTSAYTPLIANSVTGSKKGFSFNYVGNTNKSLEIFLTNGSSGYKELSVTNAITSIGWYHIYITMNGLNTATIYINGSPVAMGTPSGTYTPITGNATDPLRIGSESLNLFFMTGRIGPVQIYDTEFAQAQVQMNFNADRSRYGL